MSKKEPADKIIDVISHFLVPEHKILSEEEKKEFLEKYAMQFRDIPKISHNDIVVKTLGAKIGDILRIKRKSATAGETFYYRGVVHA